MRVLVCPACGARGYGDKRRPPDPPGWHYYAREDCLKCEACGWQGQYHELIVRRGMALDIEALKLTEEEITEAYNWGLSGAVFTHAVAEAQFAKLAWGLMDYLEAEYQYSSEFARQHITAVLEAAGIERPATGQ